MSGVPRRWAIRMGAKQYLLATTDQLRDLERSEVVTTPGGLRYVIAGSYVPSRAQLMADYRAEYEMRNQKLDGSHAYLAALASESGPVKVSPQDVSKWLRGPKTVYPHGIDDGTGKDLAIRNAIGRYVPSRAQLMADYRAEYEMRNQKLDGSHTYLAARASESGPVKVSPQDVSKWLRGPKRVDRHGIDDGTGKDLAIRNAIGRYLIES